VKKLLYGTLVAAIAVAALAVTALPALAASPSATDLTSGPAWLRPGPDLAVFGIDLSGGNGLQTLSAVNIDFTSVSSNPAFLMSALEASPDGVAVWRDDNPSTPDVWSPSDTKLSTSYTVNGMRATAHISPAWHLPASSEGLYTLFVTVRLAPPPATQEDAAFTMTLPSDAFTSNLPVVGFSPVTSNTITADVTPPAVQWFAAPAAQTDDLYWQMSEPVVGVSSSTVAFRLHGTTTDVAATPWFDATTNRIFIHPATPLTAGEYYDAILGPGITDRVGYDLPPDSESFRAATSVSENAYGTAYAWASSRTSSAYGGSYIVDNFPNALATYYYSGTYVTWYTLTDPYQGNASVYIDGSLVARVNNYSPSLVWHVARSYRTGPGTHKLTIRVMGTRGSSAGRDTRVAIDAFADSGTLKATPSLAIQWGGVTTSGAEGGIYKADRFGTMTFVFRGTSVAWRTTLGRTMGRATVYIDGVSSGTIDNYSGVTVYQYLRYFSGLSDALHTIKIVAMNSHNSSASDSLVAVDGFQIG